MMIGVDFKVCIRDVVVGKVAEHDVVMIIGPTDHKHLGINDTEEWDRYWNRNAHSTSQVWHGLDKDVVHTQIQFMHDAGILFFPSNDFWHWSNGYFNNMDKSWYELAPSEDKATPAVKAAWENYKMIAGLCK